MTIIPNQRRFSNGTSYQVTQSKTLKFHLYFNLCWSPIFGKVTGLLACNFFLKKDSGTGVFL